MDPNAINQLGLNTNLSGSDTVLLEKVFNNISSGKQLKMSPQERNHLMSKLTNSNSSQYVPVKDIKDMDPEEKAVHIATLKKKLKDKQNGMKQVRTGSKKMQDTAKNAQTSLQEMLSKIDLNKLNTHAEQMAQSAVTNNVTPSNEIEESLDDFVDT
jgi:hypothetical protein